MAQYTQQEMDKLFDTLSPELKETLLSEETANSIYDICQRNGLSEKEIPRVARLVGNILMGVLPPDDFPKALAKELGIESARAKKIGQEVNRFILYSVKGSLSRFYKEMKFVPGGRVERAVPGKKAALKEEAAEIGGPAELEEMAEIEGIGKTEEVAKKKPGKKQPPTPREKEEGADVYRETVE